MKRYHVILLLLLTASNLTAQSSLSHVLESVTENNLQLKALRCEQQADVLDLKAENTLSGPSVEYSPFYQEGYTGVIESELVVSEEFEFPTRYLARNKQIRLKQGVQESEYQALRRDVLLSVELIWFDVIRTNQLLEMLRQRESNSSSILSMFEKRMEAGDANILELNKVKLDRMDVLTQLSQVENERMQLLAQLQQLNGGTTIEVNDSIYPEQTPEIADFASFMEMAKAANADIIAAHANLQAAEHQVSLTRQDWLPNLTVGYRRNTDRNDAVNGFIVGASFPLLSTRQKVRAAKQRQLSAELDLQQAELEAEKNLESCFNELLNLNRVLDHSDIEMMRQMLQLLGKALQHGEISALQYYTETDNIYQKMQEHIAVHCESAKLHAQLFSFEL